MATERVFPKADGDVLYASEINGLDSLNIVSGFTQSEVACSQTNGSKTVANATIWILKNTGANNVYINFGGAATTSKFYLKPNEEIQFQLQQTQLNYICGTGLTSTLSVIAGVGAWKRYSNFLSSTTTINATTTAVYNAATSYSNWLISNDGSNDIFIRFSATATTSDYRIKSGESLSINYPAKRLDAISASSTSIARVWAVG